MNAKRRNVKRLAVELDKSDFLKIERNAKREHRNFSDEVRRIVKEAYAPEATNQPTAATAGAV